MVVLGIDTSLRSTGYGVLLSEGSSMRAIDMGAIRNAREVPLSGCFRNPRMDVGVPIYEYEPRRMKMAVCGNGLAEKLQVQLLAEKLQVQRMVKTLLALPELPQNDAADALGLAIAHVHGSSVLNIREPI